MQNSSRTPEGNAAVHYRILPVDPQAHQFEVTCVVARPDPAGQRLSLPAWIPGSYMIRDFARNILSFEASAVSGVVRYDKLDKQTWQCEPAEGPLTIVCRVYAWDLSVRAAHLDTSHGFFNGTSVFLCVEGCDDQPCTVEILPPEGPGYTAWRLATSLPCGAGTGEWQFGLYQASSYDELIDHPVEMGCFETIPFEANGTRHELVLTGQYRTDSDRLARDLGRICTAQIDFFGAPAPFSRYLFLTMVTGDGYGGLEHRASTSLLCARKTLPAPQASEVSSDYRNFLGLCSHEYFHSWNVKRIQPAVFHPFELDAERYTRLLWVFEGFTSYYDDLFLVRSGLITADSYLELLGQTATRVMRGAGRKLQSVAESSFDAWSRFYKQDENASNAIVSYYAKGALVAVCLDLHIRQETRHEKSLDDVMRLLWREYGQAGRGVGETEMPDIIQRATGIECGSMIEAWSEGTDDLPLAGLLEANGVSLRMRSADGLRDQGGKPGAPRKTDCAPLSLGVVAEGREGFVKLLVVRSQSPAERSGLAAGDLLIAIDGMRVTVDGLDELLSRYAPGDVLTCHAMRHDELREYRLELTTAEESTAFLEISDADAAARWLGVRADSDTASGGSTDH